MAGTNTNKTRQHDPDVQRDFETGTVNPGPGMAPPHRADDIPAGSMTETQQSQNTPNSGGNAGKNEKSETSTDTKGNSGNCGCG
jgi:hypothetical protein